MRTQTHITLLVVLSSLLAACGTGSFGTDVPPETVFDDATPEDLSDLCVAISNELLALATGPVTRTICTAAGVLVDSAAISCGEVRSECVNEAPPPEVTSCDNINANAFDAFLTAGAASGTPNNALPKLSVPRSVLLDFFFFF